MTSKLVVNTIEADTGISSVSFASSISLSSTSKFHFSAAGIDIDADTNINRPAAGVIGFNINSSEKVRIQSNGRVGISTDNPVSALHVLGTTHALGNGGASLVWGDSVYLAALTFDGSAQPVVRAASGKSLVFQVNQSTEALRITSGGNVAINKTAGISAKLHIGDTGNNGALSQLIKLGNDSSNAGTGAQLNMGAGSGVESTAACIGGFYDGTGTSFIVKTAGTYANQSSVAERVRITNLGKVGIGISTPAGLLEVQKNGVPSIIANYNNSKHIQMGAGSNGAGFHLTTGNFFTINQQPYADRGTDNNLTERFRLSSEGYVTKPNHPAFIAGRTGGNQTFTVGTYPFNVARLNVGNHYNTSTYKFVAPVAGVYYFHGQVYYNNGSGQYRLHIRKTPNGGSAINLNTSSHKAVGNDTSDRVSIIESMAVGDSVELYSDQNHSIQCYYNINDNTYGAHTYFMGYLIG